MIQSTLLDNADRLLELVADFLADAGRLTANDAWWLFAAGAGAVLTSIALLRAR